MSSHAQDGGDHATAEAIIRRYLAAMVAGDLDTVLSCFAPAGVVLSPVFGRMASRPFYERLFADTLHVEIGKPSIYRSTADAAGWIAHFSYRWDRREKPTMDTELIDLFRLGEGARIDELRIVIAGVRDRSAGSIPH